MSNTKIMNDAYRLQYSNTCETTTAVIWSDTVQTETIRIYGEMIPGVSDTGSWLRLDAQKAVIARAYRMGEPAWMAIDELVSRAEGAVRAQREINDQRVISHAVRTIQYVTVDG